MAIEIPRVKLGTQGFEVSKLGFGCMSLTGHDHSVSDEDGIAIIKHAVERGVTHIDTADLYGPKTNEILVGKALKHLPREKVQLATKFGVESMGPDGPVINGTPEFVRSSLEASLQRLDVDYIDLYYIIRVDGKTPIEDTMEELKKLVEEGKIKYIGISEASPETIRRAHAVHPLTAVQLEWSLWTRDVEEELIPLCRELGIGIVAYSPLGHGFFAGKAKEDTSNSSLEVYPRFQGENLEQNRILYSKVEKLAEKHGCTPAQLALAWVLHQGDDVSPIPGTTKIKNLDSNIESVKVKLTKEDLKEISDAIPIQEVAGGTYPDDLKQFTWKYGNTPPKKSA
ncbi:probable aldo-keto reductase 1 isoform X1 [Gossypium arboreum]|uniref:probable aldo-keto reductase 1 isoform X1 n=1 Tax=Gossypium arboreum TaxID=29729 RepID=UPI000818F613|nr:probable aldo-keto reductase 1 isoform X1 [Gossypium arboreum]